MSYKEEDFWLIFKYGDPLTLADKKEYGFVSADGKEDILTVYANGDEKQIKRYYLSTIKFIPELEEKRKIANKAREKLTALSPPVPREKWFWIEPPNNLVLVETNSSSKYDRPFNYGTLNNRVNPDAYTNYSVSTSADSIALYERIRQRLDPLGTWTVKKPEFIASFHSTSIKNIYLLTDIEKALAAFPDLPDSTIPSTPTTPDVSTPTTPTTPDVSTPSTPTTPATSELLTGLPSMTGFENSALGTGDCVWASPCHVLADRDLEVDETVHVWAVDPIDGRVLKTVSLKATEADKARVAWPAALVKAIQADERLTEDSVLLQAGHLSNDAELTENADAPTSQTFLGYNNVEKSQVDRLWAFDSHCKLFSNLPFKANQVCALTLADATPSLAERACIQVRHRHSQHLYESHIFQPEAYSTHGSWSKQLCEFLNPQSAMLRAGKRQDDGISITPAEQGNQLWIPQLSELSVQLESIGWVKHADFSTSSNLTSPVVIAVHDDVTGLPLKGSPFTFIPGADAQTPDKWPQALASKFGESTNKLRDYLKLEKSPEKSPTGEEIWTWSRAGIPLRILMSEPLASPAWSSRSSKDIDDLLDACLDGESVQLVIESRDTRTGHLCYSSSITLSAKETETETDQAAKRARLAKKLNEHLKQEGAAWLALSTDSSVSGTSQNIWKVREATVLQLQTTLEKVIPTSTATDIKDTNLPFNINKNLMKGPIQVHNSPLIAMDPLTLDSPISDIYYLYSEFIQNPLALKRKITKNLTQINIKFNTSIMEYLKTEEFLSTSKNVRKKIREFMPIVPPYLSIEFAHDIPHKTSITEASGMIMRYCEQRLAGFGVMENFFQPNEILSKIISDRKLIKQTLSNLATTQCHLASIDFLNSSSRGQLCIMLDAQAIGRDFSLVSCSRNENGFALDLNAPIETDGESAAARILIGIVSPYFLWKKIQNCNTRREANFEVPARDTLCADMANTNGSELFASSGSQLHGVSPQTGLFHFHHPIATLSSLSGSTPAIPLAINYSPLRANESALGDGFAFSALSSYDNRKRRLVLSNGTVDELSIDDIKKLISGESIERLGYTLKAGNGTTDELSAEGVKREVYHLKAFTVEHLNGHEEVLGLPQDSDKLESGGAYKDKVKSILNEVIARTEKALEDLKTPSKDAPPVWGIIGLLVGGIFGATAGSKADDYEKTQSVHLYSFAAGLVSFLWGAELVGKDREKLKHVIANKEQLNTVKTEVKLKLADIERNALILVPLQLKADNRALQLDWKGVNGHVRLNSIKDGANVLLKAEHDADPVLEGNQRSVFTLWPETDERCCITLDIKDCLLRRLTRSSGSETDKPDQRLHFQYAVTPTLDNVLCCVAEDDSSREVVTYDWAYDWEWDWNWDGNWDGIWDRNTDWASDSDAYTLPRVTLHTYVPGGQQPNTHHVWAWEGEKQITAATRYAHAPVGSDLKQVPFTRWEWSYIDDETVKPDPQPKQKPEEEPEENKKVMQLDRQIEEVPGEQRRITAYSYSTDMTLPKPLRRPRQTAQHITVEDLRVAATAEEPQP